MSALAYPAGIGIMDEFPVKIRIQNPIDGVVDEPVADAGLMDIPRLRVAYLKCLISAVFIGFFF